MGLGKFSWVLPTCPEVEVCIQGGVWVGGRQLFALRTQRATVTGSENLEIGQEEWGWGGTLLEEEKPGSSGGH